MTSSFRGSKDPSKEWASSSKGVTSKDIVVYLNEETSPLKDLTCSSKDMAGLSKDLTSPLKDLHTSLRESSRMVTDLSSSLSGIGRDLGQEVVTSTQMVQETSFTTQKGD